MRRALALASAIFAACTGTAGTTSMPVPTTPPSITAPATSTTTTTVAASTATTVAAQAPTTVARVPLAVGEDPAPPLPGILPEGATGVAVAAAGGAALAEAPGGDVTVVAREGLVFPVQARTGSWLQVRTTCETLAWLDGSGAAFHPARQAIAPGPGFDFAAAVIVLDPGHGGPNEGARGPSGLLEKFVNLDIARRARDLLAAPRSIDPATGAVLPGDDIPAAGRVWLTRTEGPPGADVEAGLTYRAEIANRAGADAFVSIHNNAEPDGPFDGPGSEVYYRFLDPESRRLAGIMVEELRRSLGAFDADWVGDTDAGAKPRLRADGVTDLYGVLRASDVPAVIAEGAFISNPAEEALLGTEEFRHAYAEAVYRALVRFLTTDDPGSGFTDPYPRTVPPGRGAPQEECQVPAQP